MGRASTRECCGLEGETRPTGKGGQVQPSLSLGTYQSPFSSSVFGGASEKRRASIIGAKLRVLCEKSGVWVWGEAGKLLACKQ